MKLVSSALKTLLIALVTFVLFDIFAYFFVPYGMTEYYPTYRAKSPLGMLGVAGYVKTGYYQKHPERGFDIAPGAEMTHLVKDYQRPYEYKIWANANGCFDVEQSLSDGYIYLGGDSYTWGYTEFESKFGTLLEEKLAVPIVKCGVGHTGQRHQLSKAKSVIGRIGQAPKTMIVVWTKNDPANDYAYPHSTVVDGWVVDNVLLGEKYERVPTAEEELVQRVAAFTKMPAPEPAVRKFLKSYSLSANLLYTALLSLRSDSSAAAAPESTDSPVATVANKPTQPELKGVYELTNFQAGFDVFPYKDSEFSSDNRAAILGFKAYAESLDSELVLVLLSRDAKSLAELRDFLAENEIKHIDLGAFPEHGIKDNFWALDPHWNPQGNKVAAEIVARYMWELGY